MMAALTPRQMRSSKSSHGMHQSRGRDRKRYQFLLKRISFTIIRIHQETGAKRDKVVNIRNGRPIDIREFNNETLSRRTAQLHCWVVRAVGDHAGRRGGCIFRLSPMRYDLQFIAPRAFPLKPLTPATNRFCLIALHFAFAARQTTFLMTLARIQIPGAVLPLG